MSEHDLRDINLKICFSDVTKIFCVATPLNVHQLSEFYFQMLHKASKTEALDVSETIKQRGGILF